MTDTSVLSRSATDWCTKHNGASTPLPAARAPVHAVHSEGLTRSRGRHGGAPARKKRTITKSNLTAYSTFPPDFCFSARQGPRIDLSFAPQSKTVAARIARDLDDPTAASIPATSSLSEWRQVSGPWRGTHSGVVTAATCPCQLEPHAPEPDAQGHIHLHCVCFALRGRCGGSAGWGRSHTPAVLRDLSVATMDLGAADFSIGA
ncbi:hypothetical protein DFH27DRAFT_607054 [Peziza echinospora]|nr:hypothetical protein DFH27DRAFT_607054 [Peziza echinospora]